MIRRDDVKAKDILNEFTSSVAEVLDQLDEKYEYLKLLKESERTIAFQTDKIIANWFNKRGGTSI